jgi:hypothetical protein
MRKYKAALVEIETARVNEPHFVNTEEWLTVNAAHIPAPSN